MTTWESNLMPLDGRKPGRVLQSALGDLSGPILPCRVVKRRAQLYAGRSSTASPRLWVQPG
jgi:hypothetical protein